MITSSVTLPELATKNPLAQRCRPQQALFRWLYSRNRIRELISLYPLHQVTRRHVRRTGDEQVNMVLAVVDLENLDLQLRTDRSHDLAEPEADVAAQQFLAVFRDPHQVELDVETGVGCATVMLHPSVILEWVA